MLQATNILARLNIPAGAEQTLFTVTGGSTMRLQGLTFCNRNNGAASFRMALCRAGAPTAAGDYVYYDLPMIAHDTLLTELDVTLYAHDVIRVYSATGNVTAILYGQAT